MGQQYEQPRRRRRHRRRRRRRRGATAVFVLTAAVVAAVIFGISLFFKVGFVEVTGTSVCKTADIIIASGVQSGDLLFFTNKSTIVHSVMAAQPYVDKVTVKRKMPNIIQIQITECVPVAFLTLYGNHWLIDIKGKLLEKTTERPSLPEIKGLTLLVPLEGTEMEVGNENRAKVEHLLKILAILTEKGFVADVRDISYDSASGISFTYQERFLVKLGIPTDIEKKLNGLPEVVSECEPNAQGTIDLTDVENKIYRFIPS